MGLFGNDNEPSQGEQLIDEQLANTKAEMEAKKQSLYETRLDIIKGQGQENWRADRTRTAPSSPSAGKGRPGLPFGLDSNTQNPLNPRR